MTRRNILSLSPDAIEALVREGGEPRYRSDQLFAWLHEKRVETFEAMHNLPTRLRQTLATQYTCRSLTPLEHRISQDGLTEKWLWETTASFPEKEEAQGERERADFLTLPPFLPSPSLNEENRSRNSATPPTFETVLIRELRGTRRTVCVSCAIGCPLGCVFCATGASGWLRPLSVGEILEQIYRVDAACRGGGPQGSNSAQRVDHVVFMGMGEPLLHLETVLAAIAILTDPRGIHLSARHITLSTVGVTPAILRLASLPLAVRLAVSLHAPNQALRETLLPAAKIWPLDPLLEALRIFAEVASREITIEYCLIHNVNDRLRDAEALASLLQGLPCKINLIPLNPVPHYEGKPSPRRQIRAFQSVLERHGRTVTVRYEKGRDIDAACGQLRARRNTLTPTKGMV